jgi:flagellar protein FlbD
MLSAIGNSSHFDPARQPNALHFAALPLGGAGGLLNRESYRQYWKFQQYSISATAICRNQPAICLIPATGSTATRSFHAQESLADEIQEADCANAELASQGGFVIRLTRINKTSLAVNADLIKFVESAPDTVITLISGEKVVVAESVEQIIDLVIHFRRSVLEGVSCPAIGLRLATNTAVPGLNRKLEGHCEPGRSL